MHQFAVIFEVLATKLMLTSVPIFIKYSSSNPWTIGIFRLAITVLFFCLIARKGFLTSLKRVWILGVLFFLHWITYFFAVKTSSPSTAVIGLSTYGFILLVYSRLLFNKKIEIKYYVSVALSVLGTVIAIGRFSFENAEFVGFLWGVASAFVYAFMPIVHQKFSDVSLKHRAFSQYLGAFVLFLLLGGYQFELDLDLSNISALVYLAVVGTILGHTLWARITTNLPTKICSSIYYLAIPISMVLEAVVLSIEPTGARIFGGSLIVVSNVAVILAGYRSPS
jgi:drug/metabolite transporter (DMT)-like permease